MYKNNKFLYLFPTFVLLLFNLTQTHAAPSKHKLYKAANHFYVAISGGIGATSGDKSETKTWEYNSILKPQLFNLNSNSSPNPFYGISLGYVWHLTPKLGINLGVFGAQLISSGSGNDIDLSDNPPDVASLINYKITSSIYTLNLGLEYWQIPRAALTINEWIGRVNNKVHSWSATSVNGKAPFEFADATESSTAYGIGIGEKFRVTSHLTMGLEFAYWDLGTPHTGTGIRYANGGITHVIDQQLSLGHLTATTVSFNTAYYF